MNDLELTGLDGSEPLQFLAALGAFRVLSGGDGERRALTGAGARSTALSWRWNGGWRPVLHTAEPMAPDGVTAEVVKALAARAKPAYLTIGDTIKVSPQEFREFAEKAARQAQPRSREWVDFCAAFGCEAVVARSTGDVKPTALDMTSGQQKFLGEARALSESFALSAPPRSERSAGAKLHEALFGPWTYQDRQHSLGWDAGAERLYALRAANPSDEKMSAVAGAVRLAFEALPLFPTVAIGRRLGTRGFAALDRGVVFTWPLWAPALRLRTIASALSLQELSELHPSRILEQRGIVAVCRARRGELGSKGYAIFRATEMCW